jgi:hypothetical protein
VCALSASREACDAVGTRCEVGVVPVIFVPTILFACVVKSHSNGGSRCDATWSRRCISAVHLANCTVYTCTSFDNPFDLVYSVVVCRVGCNSYASGACSCTV